MVANYTSKVMKEGPAMSNQIEVWWKYPDGDRAGFIWVHLAGEVYTTDVWTQKHLDECLDDWRAQGAKVHEE